MGIRVTVGDYEIEAASYSASEESTPLLGNDSSGGVSTVSISFPLPDEHAPLDGDRKLAAFIDRYGAEMLEGYPFELRDDRRGTLVGTVDSVSVDEGRGLVNLGCLSSLGALAIYDIQAGPYSGTLGGAFAYYLSLAGITDPTAFRVDESIADRPVNYIGWHGELWYHLKQMSVAQGVEITLVGGVIELRDARTRVVDRGRLVSRTRSSANGAQAREIEVYNYNTEPLSEGVVYPSPVDPRPAPLTVPAGGTAEYTIDLGASVASITQPTATSANTISPRDRSRSFYVISDEDGRGVNATTWRANGGSLRVEVNPDTTTATVYITGAVIPRTTRNPFSYTIGWKYGDEHVNGLVLLGEGVGYRAEKAATSTGAPASEASSEVGITVNNIFATNASEAARVALGAIAEHSGGPATASGELVAISRRGNAGDIPLPTYDAVHAELIAETGSTEPTWGQARDYYESLGLSTIGDFQQHLRERIADSHAEQVFGNIQGARYYDEKTRRWYRIRSGAAGAGTISFDAEEDITVQDMQELYEGLTYADVQAIFEGFTYKQARKMGMYIG